MKLSVIIVNYNVKYFLEQCLCSLQKAVDGIATEVFIVDNHSSDGSMGYLQPKFPDFRFIGNTDNPGFGKANNQALALATGKYILFLNPDTIVAEDSFRQCLQFMEAHPQAGGLGVRMIDGSGRFLKESKRGMPSPWVSFCKLSGLTALFPHSTLFARYYLGHLSERENNEVDVLAGAFMMLKKEALDKTGGFDERFFMYGEDIDLSYRIQQCGYLNYYLADASIIHFKGESTRKDLRYVKYFYKAMSQFMRKHYSGGLSFIFLTLMEFAIWLRAGMHSIIHFLGGEKKVQHDKKIKTFLTGNTGNTTALTTALLSNNRTIVQNKGEATEIIFCEGKDLSFYQIIDQLQQEQLRCKFHAAFSKSIVGSDVKSGMGETIPL